ncbi:MAG: hypothetical protein ACYSUY_02565 [Planctomycetota bacterium]|jgi:hypothetical protein
MNTNLLAISNIFAGTSGIGQDPAKPTAVRKGKQFPQPTIDNRPFTNARGTETVDNTLVNPHNKLNKETPSEFGPIPGTKVPQKGENSKNATKQNQTLNQAIQPSMVQLWLAQYSLNAEHGKEGVARKVEPKAGYELAQLLTNLKPDKSLSKSLTNLRPDKSPSVAGKTIRPQTSETLAIINQKQIGLKTALPVTSKKPLITDTPSDEGENASRVRMPETRPLPTKGPDNEQSGEGLPLEANIRAQNRITTANGKPEAVPVSNAFGSQKTPPLVKNTSIGWRRTHAGSPCCP